MKKYHKIETIFNRDINGSKKLILNEFRDPTVEYLQDNTWVWTEKVDGTNIRIYWDGHAVSISGRTDNATLPDFLMNRLETIFCTAETEEMFEQLFGEKEVYLFGEGYGNKIQKVGKDYISGGVGFILFDVLISENYQPRKTVEQIAEAFGIPIVPIVGQGTLNQAIDFVKTNPQSALGTCKMEGVVCRPQMELRNRNGERVIVKIKWNDFKDI